MTEDGLDVYSYHKTHVLYLVVRERIYQAHNACRIKSISASLSFVLGYNW